MAEHLVNNQSCNECFNFERYMINICYYNMFEIVRWMDAVCILNRKPIFCRQEILKYIFALIT